MSNPSPNPAIAATAVEFPPHRHTQPGDALDLTRKSLRENGNLSSVSILDVLSANLTKPPGHGEMGLMIAMGPGFCSELVLLEW